MKDQKLFTLSRKLHDKNWTSAQGDNYTYTVYYAGLSPQRALHRFISHHDINILTDLIRLFQWVASGYYQCTSTLTITVHAGTKTEKAHRFTTVWQRRDEFGRYLPGRSTTNYYQIGHELARELACKIREQLVICAKGMEGGG